MDQTSSKHSLGEATDTSLSRRTFGAYLGVAGLFCAVSILAARLSSPRGRVPAAVPSLVWEQDIDRAFARAKVEVSWVFMLVSAEWCSVCRRFESETLREATVRNRLDRYVLLSVDSDKDPELAARYGTAVLPTLVVFDAARNVLAKSVGFLSADELLRFLARAEARSSP